MSHVCDHHVISPVLGLSIKYEVDELWRIKLRTGPKSFGPRNVRNLEIYVIQKT